MEIVLYKSAAQTTLYACEICVLKEEQSLRWDRNILREIRLYQRNYIMKEVHSIYKEFKISVVIRLQNSQSTKINGRD